MTEEPRGRPARISRRDIAGAVLDIGFTEVTLSLVAEYLGVDHSSLYRHIKGREDMLFAAADLAIAQLDWEIKTDSWRAYLNATAEAVWALYTRYPGLAETIRNLAETPPAGIRAFACACRRLEILGFAPEDAVLIMDSIIDMTADSASGWQRLATSFTDGSTIKEHMQRSWHDAMAIDEQTAKHIRMMESVISGDPKDWWQRKLDILLDGAAVRRLD